MAKRNFLKTAKLCVQLKCPNCGEAKVFEDKGDKFLAFPEMHKKCPQCNYRFDREPGYFLGAMFVSYALAVAQGLVCFFALKFGLPQLEYFTIACSITVVILFCSISNYKLARVIWINLFP
ncbi:MAG: DUF983 domain-containing protein [Bacteroidota bacterium]